MAYDQRDELKLQVYMLWFKIVFFFLKCTSFIHSLLLQSCEHWHAEKCRACPFSLNSDHIDRESFLVKKESKRQS